MKRGSQPVKRLATFIFNIFYKEVGLLEKFYTA